MMKSPAPFNALSSMAITLLLLGAAGCGRDQVKVYEVDTNDTATVAMPPSSAMPSAMPPGLAVPDNSLQPKLQYTLPEGWKEKTPTQMRVASFEAVEAGKTADVSVIPLGGMAGGDVANVNRWRGQVGQAALAEADVLKLAEKVELAGQPADLYDVNGTSPGSGDPERILAVIFHRNETAWFFKVTGDSALVEKQKPAFVAFLKSVQFVEGAAPSAAGMDMSQLPASHPPIGGMGDMSGMGGLPGASAPAGPTPTWTVPAGGETGPLAQFLVAKFLIAGAGDAKAEVNVSQLSGDGGGLLANVNRWRKQLGAAPMAEADLAGLATVTAAGVPAKVVEFSGTNPRTGKPAQLVGVVLPLGGQTWFYKLMGDAEVVAQQKAALLSFVQSAKYPDVH